MAFIPLASAWRAGALALLLTGIVLAQAPAPQLDEPKRRQPTPSSIQQQESLQASADKRRAETDRKAREMDRRLNRTLRSVCTGC